MTNALTREEKLKAALPKDMKVDFAKLGKRRSLFIGAPMFGGLCQIGYHQSIIGLIVQCERLGIPYNLYEIPSDALITRARSTCTDMFRQLNYTNMIFIDTDIQFDPMSVLHLFALQEDNSPYDIIGAAYPRKSINWPMVHRAAQLGHRPEELHKFVGDFVFNPFPNTKMSVFAPSIVPELGTGFMMIRRNTFDVLEKAHPEWTYKPDGMTWKEFHESTRTACHFWGEKIDPISKRLLSEDYQFCQSAHNIGLKTWLCPWVRLTHTGKFDFSGSMTENLLLHAEIQNAEQRSNAEVEEAEFAFGLKEWPGSDLAVAGASDQVQRESE